MASLNDVLQGLVNLDSKSITNIKNILESLGNGFIDIGTLNLSNNTLSLQNATILAKGLCKDVSLSTSFSGNKICFLEFKSDKSVAFKVLNTVDANFSYDLSQLKSSSIYFEVARQYNGKYEDIRLSNILAKDNSIIKTLNKLLKDIKDLDSSKIDASYVEQALANLSTYATKTELNNAINGLDTTYVTHTEMTNTISGLDTTYVTHTEMTNAKYATKTELNNAINGCQKTSDSSLSTTNKTIVGAINELFQSANNGKQLIADAIGEPLSSEQTFSAMSDNINNLLGTFRTELAFKSISTSDNDKLKELISKMSYVGDDLQNTKDVTEDLIKNRFIRAGISNYSYLSYEELLNLLLSSNITPNKIKDISTSSDITMVLKSNGDLYVWGNNTSGQLGLSTSTTSYNKPTLTQSSVQSIAAGVNHAFLIKNNGNLYGCGNNMYYKLGIGSIKSGWNSITTNVKKVVCTESTSFILKTNGTLWACGYNNSSMFGFTSSAEQTLTQIATDVKDMAISDSSSYIIKNDGTLWACGNNNYGQLGLGDKTSRTTFTQVVGKGGMTGFSAGNKVVKVSACSTHAVAITDDGNFWFCGKNHYGQFGTPTSEYSESLYFTKLVGSLPFETPLRDVCTYAGHGGNSIASTYVLDARGNVYVAGYFNAGQSGRSCFDFTSAIYSSISGGHSYTLTINDVYSYDDYVFKNNTPYAITLNVDSISSSSTTNIVNNQVVNSNSSYTFEPGNSTIKVTLKFFTSNNWSSKATIENRFKEIELYNFSNPDGFNIIGLNYNKYVSKLSVGPKISHLFTSDGEVYSTGADSYYDMMTTDVACFTKRTDIP